MRQIGDNDEMKSGSAFSVDKSFRKY